MEKMTTQKQVRAAFWELWRSMYGSMDVYYRSRNKHATDVRCAFVDFVDMLARDGPNQREARAKSHPVAPSRGRFPAHEGESMNTAQEAAAHWRSLAESERRMAAHEEALGYPRGSTDVYYHKADTYDRTARALELEAETGKAHCSMCFGPHPNHEHKAGARV